MRYLILRVVERKKIDISRTSFLMRTKISLERIYLGIMNYYPRLYLVIICPIIQ